MRRALPAVPQEIYHSTYTDVLDSLDGGGTGPPGWPGGSIVCAPPAAPAHEIRKD